MNKELLKTFDMLDINNKRNTISNELLTIGELINSFEKTANIPLNLKVKNYDQNNDSIMSEDEILTFFYEDIYNIEQELITLLTLYNNQNRN